MQQPKSEVIADPDRVGPFGSHEWQALLQIDGLVAGMNRHGVHRHNAVLERFFRVLERKRVRAGSAPTLMLPGGTPSIEMFCNPERHHGWLDRLSPVEYERRPASRLDSDQESRGDSGHHACSSIWNAKGKG